AQVPDAPPCTYVKLGELKPGAVVNVYGVVVFFKQPFKSRGSDLCSFLKISDQSGQKVSCNIFSAKPERHPQIFQIGDIVNRKAAVITTYGFSALAFSGTVGAEVEPRGSGPTRRLSEEDRRIVTELRSWAAGRDLLPPDPTVSLARVQPRMYFNLACQLLAKAPVDSRCTLLRVWDGTRCPHALLNVTVDSDVVEGPPSFAEEQEKLIVNVLVYDDHAQSAQQLKVSIPTHPKKKKKKNARWPTKTVDRLSFHLHGGTAYSRGVRRLPDDTAPLHLEECGRQMFGHPSIELIDVCCPLLATTSFCLTSPDKSRMRSTHAHLSYLEEAPRAQLRSYEPRRLHRALKLYCSKCTSIVFAEGYGVDLGAPSARPPPCAHKDKQPFTHTHTYVFQLFFAVTFFVCDHAKCHLNVSPGSTLEEARHLAGTYRNVVPVHSAPGCHPTLLDLSAPFLFRGKRRFYGSGLQTSQRQPPRHHNRLVTSCVCVCVCVCVCFRLQDASDALDVFLWRDESFFDVSADDAATNQEAQDQIQRTMDSLCPPKGAGGERPWLDLCLAAYRATDVESRQTFYQICHTSVKNALTQKDTSP
uniref:Protection of telomeres protein 1 n=1 Tax=Hippocampus comes TaxID=109280 RepID=A0A3Q2YU84_HIPCM